MELDAPRRYLAQLVAEHDTDLKTLSTKVLGRNHAYLQQYLTKGTPKTLGEDDRAKLAEHFQVEPDAFKTGPRRGIRERVPLPSVQQMLEIEELDVRAGSATGGQVHEREDRDMAESVVALWRLPAKLIRSYTPAPAERIKIITNVGNSNEPLLMAAQPVIVDTSDKVPTPPGLFAIWDGFGELIKILEMIPYSDPPKVIVKSGNPAYPEPREMRLADLVINGRVIGKWTWT